MSRLPLAFVLVLVTVAHPARAQAPPDAAIRQAVQKYVVAFNARDADAAAALYAPDGTHTYALGFTHRGRGEIARGLKEQFAGPMRGATLSIKTLHVRHLAPAIAVEEESFTLEGVTSSDNRPLPPLRGFCLAVHQQLEEGWRAAAVQCLLPPPPPPGTS